MTERDGERVDVLAMHRKAFGARLRTIRRLQNVTQEKLAARVDMTRTSLSEIEAGDRNVTLDTMWRLAHGLGVHVADLIDDRRSVASVEMPETPQTPPSE